MRRLIVRTLIGAAAGYVVGFWLVRWVALWL
jgi:hypothetical protein